MFIYIDDLEANNGPIRNFIRACNDSNHKVNVYALSDELNRFSAFMRQPKRYRRYISKNNYFYYNYREIVFATEADRTAFLLRWS